MTKPRDSGPRRTRARRTGRARAAWLHRGRNVSHQRRQCMVMKATVEAKPDDSVDEPTVADSWRKRAEARVGQVIGGRMTLERVLGVGGTASVYAARHRNGRALAVKVLHPEFAHHDAIRRRFLAEGYAANKVDHPGAVAILDEGEDADGNVFIVMELLRGRTLLERLVAAMARCPRQRSSRSRCACSRCWRKRTIAASCTATSSRAIFSRPTKAACCCSTSGSRAFKTDRPRFRRGPAPRSARPPSWRPSSPPGGSTSWTRSPISGRWARPCSNC